MTIRRRGTTFVELLLTLAVLGILTSVTMPRAVSLVDRISVKGATQDVVLALAAARAAASRRGAYASFIADPRTGRIRVVSQGETERTRVGHRQYDRGREPRRALGYRRDVAPRARPHSLVIRSSVFGLLQVPKSYPPTEIRGIACPITRSIERTIAISSAHMNV